MSYQSAQPSPPVKEGDIVEVTIEGQGGKGDGIARVKGFVLFVPGVRQGERHRVKITKVLAKVGFAEVVKHAPKEEQEKPPVAPQEQQPAPEEALGPGPEDSETFGEEEEGDDGLFFE